MHFRKRQIILFFQPGIESDQTFALVMIIENMSSNPTSLGKRPWFKFSDPWINMQWS